MKLVAAWADYRIGRITAVDESGDIYLLPLIDRTRAYRSISTWEHITTDPGESSRNSPTSPEAET